MSNFRATAKSLFKETEARAEHAIHRIYQTMALLRQGDPWLTNAHNLYKGKRCFIIGNGPSLLKTDLKLLKNEITFGVNGIFLYDGFSPTFYSTVSSTFWKYHIDEIKKVKCERRFLPRDMRELDSNVPTSWLNMVSPKYESYWNAPLPVPAYFSKRPDKIIQAGGTVIFILLQLAYYMGFTTVVLLGVNHDYGLSNTNANSVGFNKYDSLRRTHFTPNYYANGAEFHVDINAMEYGYHIAKKVFDKSGRIIVNATPESKLEIFKRVKYDDVLRSLY